MGIPWEGNTARNFWGNTQQCNSSGTTLLMDRDRTAAGCPCTFYIDLGVSTGSVDLILALLHWIGGWGDTSWMRVSLWSFLPVLGVFLFSGYYLTPILSQIYSCYSSTPASKSGNRVPLLITWVFQCLLPTCPSNCSDFYFVSFVICKVEVATGLRLELYHMKIE